MTPPSIRTKICQKKTGRDLLKSAPNSEYMQWLRSKNELDHHLGNNVYAGKQRKWQEEDEILAQQGFENPYDNFCGCLGPFVCARSKLTESSNVSFYS
jgi:hypothetical protein